MKSMMLLLIVGSSIPAAHASEPFASEIEDGSWVKFHVTVDDDNMSYVLETTIKAVGRTQEAGEDCQWIEIGSVATATGQRRKVVKLLFREKDLGRGDVGITDVVRAWILPRDSDQPVQAAGDQLSDLAPLFPGQLDNERRSHETETIDVQGELLECDILEGESEAELGNQTVTVLHRLLLNDEIPFGLAGFRKEIRSASGMRIVAEAQLLETGGDAESLMPDSQ